MFFDGDEFGFDRASNKPTATRKATSVIRAKNVNANDASYDQELPLAA